MHALVNDAGELLARIESFSMPIFYLWVMDSEDLKRDAMHKNV